MPYSSASGQSTSGDNGTVESSASGVDDAQAALDRVRDGDPYHKRGMAQYELLPWAPTIGVEALDAM